MRVYATLSFGCIEAKQIEDETTDDSQIGTVVFYMGPHLVVTQGDIKTTMESVFNTPMSAHRIGQNARLRGNAAEYRRRSKLVLPLIVRFASITQNTSISILPCGAALLLHES